ncbi:MAG: hypothetical protein L6Q60_00690 [Rhodocyclaceae bacterium]|nr:hypothetical protein [Rhodocyclaceae bacterium]
MQSATRKRTTPAPRRARKLRFIASVRFDDGHRGCFSVDNAKSHEEARRMVFEELDEVAAVVISDYQ